MGKMKDELLARMEEGDDRWNRTTNSRGPWADDCPLCGCPMRNHSDEYCVMIQQLIEQESDPAPPALPAQGSPEYKVWFEIIQVCTQPMHALYYQYGGKGIGVCPRWRHSFEAFYQDVGAKPSDSYLDRINRDGDFTKANCRWRHHEYSR